MESSKDAKEAENELRGRIDALQLRCEQLEGELRDKDAETRRVVDQRLGELTEELEEEKSKRISSLLESHRVEKEELAEMARKEKESTIQSVARQFETDLLTFQQQMTLAGREKEDGMKREMEASMQHVQQAHEQQMMQLLEEIAARQQLVEKREAEIERLHKELAAATVVDTTKNDNASEFNSQQQQLRRDQSQPPNNTTTFISNQIVDGPTADAMNSSSSSSTPRINCDISTSKSPSVRQRKSDPCPSSDNVNDDVAIVGPGGDAKSYDRLVEDLRKARADVARMSDANHNLLRILSDVVHSNLSNEDVINNRLQVSFYFTFPHH